MSGRAISSRFGAAALAALLCVSLAPPATVRAAPLSTTTTLAVAPGSATYGDTVVLTATVSDGGSGPNEGTVDFADGATTFGTAPVVGDTATLSTTAIPAGSYANVVASYGGTGSFLPSDSSAAPQPLDIAKATLVVTPDPKAVAYGGPVPAYTFTVSDFVLGENAGSADGYVAPSCTSSYTITTPVSASPRTISCSGGSAANYAFDTGATATLTITQASQTVSFVSPAPVGATVGGSTYTPIGTATSPLPVAMTIDATASSVCAIAAGVVSFTAAGTCKVDANQTGNGNWLAAAQVQQSFPVGQASTATAVGSSGSPSTYGDDVTFTAIVTPSSAAGTVTIKDGATTLGTCTLAGGACDYVASALTVRTHPITAVYGGDGDHTGSSSSPLSQVVTAKGLTVSGITAANKVYNGSTAAALNTGAAALVGVVSGDTVTLGVGSAVGTFDTTHVGAGKTVAITGVTIGGADAANYTLTQPTTAADITSRTLTVTATGINKVYDGTTNASVTLGSDKVGGDAITLAYVDASFATSSVGTGKPVTVTGISKSGAEAGDYTLGNTTALASASITTVSVTPSITGSDKAYDGTTAATATCSLAGVLPGDVGNVTCAGTATFNTKNVGTGKPVTAVGLTLGGSAAANYALTATSAATTADITQRPITVTADTQTRVYGAVDPALAYHVTSGSLAPGDAFTGALSRVVGEDVGAYPIQQHTLSAGANYELTYVGANLSVTPAPLLIAATNKTKTYGTTNPALTWSYGGLVNGDLAPGTLPTCSTTAVAGSNVGSYPITCSGAADPDYTITYAPGTLAVNKAASATSVSSTAAASVFGQSVTFTATITGQGAGLATGSVIFTIDGSAQVPVTVSGGTAQLTTSALAVGAHTVSAAYGGDSNVNGSGGTLSGGQTVAKASTTVDLTSDNASSVYGQTVTFTATVSPAAPGGGTPGGTIQFIVDTLPVGDPVDLAAGQATLVTSLLPVGSHKVGGIYGGSGSFSNSSGTLVGDQAVAKGVLTVTADDASRAYGAPDPTFSATYTGFANGEVLETSGVTGSPSLTTTTDSSTPVVGGPYAISAAVGTLVAANYSFAFATGNLSITPAPTTVTLVSDVNPAPPNQAVTLTATVAGLSTLGGQLAFQQWNGSSYETIATATLTSGLTATTQVTLPGDDKVDLQYQALFTSPDSNYADGRGLLVQSVGKSDVTVTLTASRAKWEATVPIVFTATVTPNATGVTVPITGTVDFTIDGGPPVTIPVAAGSAILPKRVLAVGAHTIGATYSGDASFIGEAAVTALSQPVGMNVVEATGVVVSGSSIYPYRDTWRDTVTIRGTRTERLSVTIRIYRPTGKLLSTRTVAAGTGAYASTWTGRYSSGTILAAGKYKIVQTLVDPSSVPALAKSWTSYVTLSTRRIAWTTVSLYKNPNAPAAWSGSPSLLTSSRYKNGARLITSSSIPGWAAFGYSFTLPSATIVKSVAFYVQGGPQSGPTSAKIGLHDWRTGTSWIAMYSGTRARRAVGTSTSAWYGIAGNPAIVVKSVSSKRYVRAFVDTGGYYQGFRYELARVRIVVTYGVLK